MVCRFFLAICNVILMSGFSKPHFLVHVKNVDVCCILKKVSNEKNHSDKAFPK